MERLQLTTRLLQDRSRNLIIKSPVDGLVISGDLKRAEGVRLTVGQTLFEVAPLDEMIPADTALPSSSGHTMALSHDGQTLVYVGTTETSTQLFLRRMNQLGSTPIPGTEGAREPSFSPDGESVAFTQDGALKKVSLLAAERLLMECVPGGLRRPRTRAPHR